MDANGQETCPSPSYSDVMIEATSRWPSISILPDKLRCSIKPYELSRSADSSMNIEKRINLWADLSESLIESAVDFKSFLPHGSLQRVISQEAVMQTLGSQAFHGTSLSRLSSYVLEEAQMTFAILVWTGNVALVDHFYHHGFVDKMLPIDLKYEAESHTWRVRSATSVDHVFNNPRWTDPKVNQFRQEQWQFLAPVFSDATWEIEINSKCPLPFVQVSSPKESHFSWVIECRVHKNHLRTDTVRPNFKAGDDHPRVAIKQLKSRALDADLDAEARIEADALKMVRKLDHAHLIKAITYYKIKGRHFFMFPWAEEGNLCDLWEKTIPTLEPVWFRWVFGQLQGLAHAIKTLHYGGGDKKICRHGDLKPENILCFEDGSPAYAPVGIVMVIADVGLTRVHHMATQNRAEGTRTITGTWMYGPPEAELHKSRPRTRRYDIWSMGCIYLEFVVWLLYGVDGLKAFKSKLDKYFAVNLTQGAQEPTARIHPRVRRWIDWIRQDARCPQGTAVRSLVELIATELLVVEIDSNGDVPGAIRTNAQHMFLSISKMSDAVENEPHMIMDWTAPPRRGPEELEQTEPVTLAGTSP